ncbi:hypothetical protein GCM10025857_28190 [Alicyclobacillus contaminans]|uniref:polymer-forming cytoskeletal protein n=1 Tax=Alicyclobacillus contaminans TaxID=392016 RepID=UPI00040459EC|nr:polymer-forming cytoskeletal protein [Alicyclobacillus contaminans]GMA51462.1 hypothetical protein GCM10025857_28190 [Alicyclobacillus contaminans]
MISEKPNLHLSGVGSASGGQYEDVSIEGVGKVHGDVECTEFRLEGVGTVNGSLRANLVELEGKATVKGDIAAETVRMEGYIKVTGDCDAESFTATGILRADGLLNADRISIALHGHSHVQQMGGSEILVKRIRKGRWFRSGRHLEVDIVEGDNVHLEATRARIVRGNSVVIGSGCEVEMVEYRQSLDIASDASVAEQRKL